MSLAGKLLLLGIAFVALMGYARVAPPAGLASDAVRHGAPAVAGAEARGPAIGAASPAGGGFPAGPAARDHAAQAPAAPGVHDDLLFPVGAIPEPGGWTLLLCSVVVLGLIALRRSRRGPG